MGQIGRIIQELEQIRNKGLYRELTSIQSPQDPFTVINGEKVMLLSSNNYLGLCNDQRLKEAAVKAIQKYGVGAGGSRSTTGTYDIHSELEEKIAKFKGVENAILFSSGYMANLAVITALTNKNWTIFCDKLNHASIIQGCMSSGAKVIRYKHIDMQDLEYKINKYKIKED